MCGARSANSHADRGTRKHQHNFGGRLERSVVRDDECADGLLRRTRGRCPRNLRQRRQEPYTRHEPQHVPQLGNKHTMNSGKKRPAFMKRGSSPTSSSKISRPSSPSTKVRVCRPRSMKDKHMNSQGFFKPMRMYGMEVPRPVADLIC